MTYYHATTVDRIPLIQKIGLRAVAEQNFPCEPGVYLAGSSALALMFAVEAATGKRQTISCPREAVENIRVIVVDRCLIDESLLLPDPNVETGWQCWIYPQTIDVTNCPVITMDEALHNSILREFVA